ncbi:MAG: SGNH/GDSL hydrolase family protein [Verrucomicrobiota bacterium]
MKQIIQTALALITLFSGLCPTRTAEAPWQNIGKILFLGNSITKHGPSAKVDWTGNWGMAASAEENDYVHLVLRSIAEATGKAPEAMVVNIAAFEREFATYDVLEKQKPAFAFKPDVVVLAIGENVPALKTETAKAEFKASLLKLLRALQADGKPTILVRNCFWPNGTKDEVFKQACEETGGAYVDISHLAKDRSNYARSERTFKNIGVANHPGDKGMQAIATALVETMKSRKLLQPAKQ